MISPDPVHPRVGPTARALGGAGLLPQFAALVLQVELPGSGIGEIVAFGYGSLILSFLGGIWWGLAMHRRERQAQLAIIAVLPSLVAAALTLSTTVLGWRWALVGLASSLVLTLVVDRRLADRGETPDGWMALRVPLSWGLGFLTLLAALIG